MFNELSSLNVTLVKPDNWNEFFPIEVSVVGISMLVSCEQPKAKFSSIEVIPSQSCIDVIDSHPSKHRLPIANEDDSRLLRVLTALLLESSKTTDSSFEQQKNAA